VRELLEKNRLMLVYLVASNFLLYFGFRTWQTLFNNFAVEELGIGPGGIGWIQALREIPGLMGFTLGFLALFFSEIRIMALSVILLGAGLVLTGFAEGFLLLVASTLVMSFGFHFFYPTNNAVVLMAVDKRDAPKTLGQLGSLNAVAMIVATGAVFLLADPWGYRTLYMIVGGLVLVGGLALLPFKGAKEGLPPRRQVVLRRRYWLYYTLSFLMGSRRHIFTTFAIFLLVNEYGISVQTTATLFLVNSLVNIFTLRWVGRLIGQLGERLMLSIAFGTLAFVFLGYAYVTYLQVLFLLFVIDNVMFGFNLALTTYFQKIAVTQEEITSNLSVEQTINHISAVVIPIIGGTVWVLFGSQAPFLVGVVIVLISLVLAQAIRTPAEPAPVSTAATGGVT
jgi:predicted MFS family arabinose efflux permease